MYKGIYHEWERRKKGHWGYKNSILITIGLFPSNEDIQAKGEIAQISNMQEFQL